MKVAVRTFIVPNRFKSFQDRLVQTAAGHSAVTITRKLEKYVVSCKTSDSGPVLGIRRLHLLVAGHAAWAALATLRTRDLKIYVVIAIARLGTVVLTATHAEVFHPGISQAKAFSRLAIAQASC
jgi:hypothetical protein